MKIIKVRDLNKVYGKKDNLTYALKNANLEINKGEFIAIIGASGSGKSTLLQLIGGVDFPTSGEVIIDNENIYNLKENPLAIFRRRNIGFVFQDFNLIPMLTVEENIEMPVLLDCRKVDKDYKKDLIKTLGLEGKEDSLPSELSGGQKQRAAIARALINKPLIVLADEPTGNLDSENSKEVLELLKVSVKKYNQTIIVVTHDINIAEEADRIIRIKDGIVTEG
ncbi:MAG: ABC transporter ATP-binding protein [Clostridium sp.]|uniref:ABC transporter ATP-binding protein n=1 Tax=Clostridium TaxID=1485 RepID=UPI00215236DB|nr:ABC transporter ATP-binding protein [Clostridium sp. LY3-2]MCR6513970.1 ABC transporter ATP-binding protein [Clostridium sp. LY3-2]